MEQVERIFMYHAQKVRTVVKGGEVWFVARDVCHVLGLARTNSVLRKIGPNQKGKHRMLTLGGSQELSIINEAGLYKLTFRSNKPEAERFTDWVTEEVLPSIRKHGAYDAREREERPSYAIDDAIERAKRWVWEQEQIVASREKASYAERILLAPTTLTVTQIAKEYGMSARTLNLILEAEDVQYRVRGQWILKAAYQGEGYTQSRTFEILRVDGGTTVVVQTDWTQKGRYFIDRLLAERGYVVGGRCSGGGRISRGSRRSGSFYVDWGCTHADSGLAHADGVLALLCY
ncbi:phage antirepressor [Shouchella shacheensis]|uniref:phage antirepressor n=1 Tax=Shouchella shacheensis TaxID=1649580 RepID=UPI000740394F|nr:phage antirepressor KilAC domain-containing protein [Shouchella shacheensis]